jgi:protein PsiE
MLVLLVENIIKGILVINNHRIKRTVHRGILHAEKALLLFIVAGTVYAAGYDIFTMFSTQGRMDLADLFLLFIYAEILGMVGAFYNDHRIPVTLPIIIAITALTRMIILTTKGTEPLNIVFESSGILILAIAAYIMTLKEKISLQKLKLKQEEKS